MNIWNFIHGKLVHNIEVMLLVVIDSSGNSPGKQGFKMAVTKSKELCGSIGGGMMEYKMVELAHAMLNSGNASPFIKHQLHTEGETDEQSGMICAGNATIAFFPLNKANLKTIDQISQAYETNGQGIYRINNTTFEFLPDKVLENICLTSIVDESKWEYYEKPGKTNKICIIGAGHVGLALSKLMREMDFIVEIYDDRLGINTFEHNEFVNKKSKIDYNNIDQLIPEGDNVYIAIMTFGHQSDEVVFKKLMDKHFKYLGMMGSEAKINSIFKKTGFSPDSTDKKKIFAPIGIPIQSQTPAEIAISIAAEIIKVKNENL